MSILKGGSLSFKLIELLCELGVKLEQVLAVLFFRSAVLKFKMWRRLYHNLREYLQSFYFLMGSLEAAYTPVIQYYISLRLKGWVMGTKKHLNILLFLGR